MKFIIELSVNDNHTVDGSFKNIDMNRHMTMDFKRLSPALTYAAWFIYTEMRDFNE